ncbi:MAG TPA: UbiA family prenyltransferase [Bryobacteraceae bacterium]|nr:UbiA family prenyltransferase [Bryobacteraceae bacterium]
MPYSETRSAALCVDLDGTLIKSDLLFESLARLFKKKPWLVLLVPFWCLRGRAALKQELARRVPIEVASLPYNWQLVEWLKKQKATNRELLLVTAADASLANQVADHLGLFDRVIASDGRQNLKGRRKLESLRTQVAGEFDYVGNSWSDLDIWQHSANAITVGASPSLVKRVKKFAPEAINFDGRAGRWRSWLAALRVHQWAKNVLIFVPLITSHQFMHLRLVLECSVGFLLFSLCSSAQYILNDLADLEADRHHATKRRRPFASGDLPIVAGFVVAPALLAASLVITAVLLSKLAAAALATYFVLSFSYSLYFKRFILLDAFILSGLYTFRIVVGHLVTGVAFSSWLLSFAFFLFLSLAFSKRWSELHNVQRHNTRIVGRGYRVDDLAQVNLFGVCSAFLSAVVFMLYLQSDKVRELYRQPQPLWLLSPVYLYWVSRLWIRSSRGEIGEDPIIFVLKDPVTYLVVAAAGAIMLVAAAGWLH